MKCFLRLATQVRGGNICFSVLDEIEERRRFLSDMVALGQEKQYVNIINAQISQVKDAATP